MPYRDPPGAGFETLLRQFGVELRRCRRLFGVSQARLAALSGVSQSSISRLERAKAPYASLQLVIQLSVAMNGRMPVAYCPHEHGCAWERLDDRGLPIRVDPAVDAWRLGVFATTDGDD